MKHSEQDFVYEFYSNCVEENIKDCIEVLGIQSEREAEILANNIRAHVKQYGNIIVKFNEVDPIYNEFEFERI